MPHICLHISSEPPNASRMAARGVAMGEEEAPSSELERLSQGISPGVAACTYPATVRCTSCQKWFCDAHAEDEQWHACMLSDQCRALIGQVILALSVSSNPISRPRLDETFSRFS